MVRPVPVRLNPRQYNPSESRVSVELSGHGNLLCYEALGGRWFRSSRESVNYAIQEFKKMYSALENFNCMSWNDLYRLLDISVSNFGEMLGYTGSEDYKGSMDPRFILTLVPADEHFEDMNEEVLVIEIDEINQPFPGYMEV